jgi:hypothetical protein
MKKIYAVALVCVSLFLPSCEIDGGIVDEGNIWIPPPPPVPKHTDIEILAFYVPSLYQIRLGEILGTGFKAVLEYAPAGSSGETLETYEYEVDAARKTEFLSEKIDIYDVDWERGSSSSWGAYAFEQVEADVDGTEYKILYISIGRTYWSANEAMFPGVQTIVISNQVGASGKTVHIECEPSPAQQRENAETLSFDEAGTYDLMESPYNYPNGIDIYDLVSAEPRDPEVAELIYWNLHLTTKVLTVVAIQPVDDPEPSDWKGGSGVVAFANPLGHLLP